MDKKYYVYKHINNIDGKVFYIGKGCNKRAYDLKSRNYKWKEYTKLNSDFRIEICFSDLTEDEAYEIEINEIKNIGIDNLTNISIGGRFNFQTISEDEYELGRIELNNILDRMNTEDTVDNWFERYAKQNNIVVEPLVNKIISKLKKKYSKYYKNEPKRNI